MFRQTNKVCKLYLSQMLQEMRNRTDSNWLYEQSGRKTFEENECEWQCIWIMINGL